MLDMQILVFRDIKKNIQQLEIEAGQTQIKFRMDCFPSHSLLLLVCSQATSGTQFCVETPHRS